MDFADFVDFDLYTDPMLIYRIFFVKWNLLCSRDLSVWEATLQIAPCLS